MITAAELIPNSQ